MCYDCMRAAPRQLWPLGNGILVTVAVTIFGICLGAYMNDSPSSTLPSHILASLKRNIFGENDEVPSLRITGDSDKETYNGGHEEDMPDNGNNTVNLICWMIFALIGFVCIVISGISCCCYVRRISCGSAHHQPIVFSAHNEATPDVTDKDKEKEKLHQHGNRNNFFNDPAYGHSSSDQSTSNQDAQSCPQNKSSGSDKTSNPSGTSNSRANQRSRSRRGRKTTTAV